MTALIRIIPLWIWWAMFGVVSSLVAFNAGEIMGSRTAMAEAEARGAKATINAMKERGLINEAVRNMDDCRLLTELGGLCNERQP